MRRATSSSFSNGIRRIVTAIVHRGGAKLWNAADQLADSVLSVSLKELAMDPLEPRFEMSFIKNHHQAIRRRALGYEIQPQIGNRSQGQSCNARPLDQSLPHQANGCFPPLNFHRSPTM